MAEDSGSVILGKRTRGETTRCPQITLADVRRAMAGPRPGQKAQGLMAPQPRTTREGSGYDVEPRQSAVLVLLYHQGGDLCLVLTKRTDTVAHHKGQVSLPGGAREQVDDSLSKTAIREAEEELGITLSDAEILGALTSLYTASSNYQIHPFVAVVADAPKFSPCAAEVAQLLEVPLATLLDTSLRHTEMWTIRERQVSVPFFLLVGHKVWGATAMILGELVAMLAIALESHEHSTEFSSPERA